MKKIKEVRTFYPVSKVMSIFLLTVTMVLTLDISSGLAEEKEAKEDILSKETDLVQNFDDWKIQLIGVWPATGSKNFNYIAVVKFENTKSGQNTFALDPTKIVMVASNGQKFLAISGALVEKWEINSEGQIEVGPLKFLSHDIVVGKDGEVLLTVKKDILFAVGKKNNVPIWSIILLDSRSVNLLISFEIPHNMQLKELHLPALKPFSVSSAQELIERERKIQKK